jgi:Na+-transporting methylmalonyl-CoA/oxaloacetate decarboxylase gamma subunit
MDSSTERWTEIIGQFVREAMREADQAPTTEQVAANSDNSELAEVA